MLHFSNHNFCCISVTEGDHQDEAPKVISESEVLEDLSQLAEKLLRMYPTLCFPGEPIQTSKDDSNSLTIYLNCGICSHPPPKWYPMVTI